MPTEVLDSVSFQDGMMYAELIEIADYDEVELLIRFAHAYEDTQFVLQLPVDLVDALLQDVTWNRSLSEYGCNSLNRRQLPQYDETWIPKSEHVISYSLGDYTSDSCDLCGMINKSEDKWIYNIIPHDTTELGNIQPRYSVADYRLHRDCFTGIIDCCRELFKRNESRLFVQFI